MKYDVDYFIKKFEAIPSWRWVAGAFSKFHGLQHCALGHCGVKRNRDGKILINTEATALENLVLSYLKTNIISINDCGYFYNSFPEATPKKRVLAALYKIKAMQSLEKPKEVIVEKIVYVTVDKQVRELQEEELILN